MKEYNLARVLLYTIELEPVLVILRKMKIYCKKIHKLTYMHNYK